MTAAAIAKAIQPMRLPAISHSEGSALSALRIRKDMLRQNSSSANRMETALSTQKNTPVSHASQSPL